MVDRTKNRSDKYQAYFNELLFSNDMMADFSERSGMAASFNDEERAILKEELLDLKDQLREEFWRLVDEELTDRQKSVMKLYADGNTQCEIAKVLGVNQSSITKSLRGNCDYRNGRKVYGGSCRKLQKLAAKDEKIQNILKRIAEIQGDE